MTRGALLAAGLAAVLAFAALPAGVASAHASLESSTPAANAVLTAGPPAILLDFDDPVDPSVASIQLFDGQARLVDTGKPAGGADSSIVQSTVPALADGTYAVVWRVTSDDGHVVDGAFAFQIGTGGTIDSTGLIDEVRNGVTSPPAVGRLYGAARAVSMFGFIVLCGGGVFALSRRPLPAALRLLRIAWLALVGGSAVAFAAYAAKVVGGRLGDIASPGVWSDAAGTHTGRVLLARMGFAGFLGILLSMLPLAAAAWWRLLAVLGSLAALLTFPLSGHPYAQHPKALWVGLDALHMASVALWIGGLVLFTLGGRAWFTDDHHAAAVRAFSRLSTVTVPLIVGTGVVATLRYVDDLGSLTDTSWGRTLLVKVTVVVVIVAIGGVSQWLLRNDGPGALRRTVATEALLGVAVIGLAAGLVGLAPSPPSRAQPFSATLSSAGVLVDVSLSPGHVGSNEVHLIISPPGGNLDPVVSVTARMTLPSADIPESPVTVNSAGPNHYIGSITLPRPGQWTLEIIVEPQPAESVALSTTVPIP